MRSRVRPFAIVTRQCEGCSAARLRDAFKGYRTSSTFLHGLFRQVKTTRVRNHQSAVTSVSLRRVHASAQHKVHQLDYTCLAACCHELQQQWTPSKVESILMAEETTLSVCVRSISQRGWLHISWHHTAARVCMGMDPERGEAAEAYPFGKLMNTRCVDQKTNLIGRLSM
jgi:hypothetical protein